MDFTNPRIVLHSTVKNDGQLQKTYTKEINVLALTSLQPHQFAW